MSTDPKKYNQVERLEIVMDIVHKLRNFKDVRGNVVNHYDDRFSFIPEFKKICNEYIKQSPEETATERSGTIDYYEMKRTIEYKLPIGWGEKSLFVFRVQK